MSLNKILVPLDGSELASKALPIAVSLAQRSEASICLITVAGGKAGDFRFGDSELYLEEVADSVSELDISACSHVCVGNTVEQIARIADEEEIDLIVMTTRGRSGITRGILGSVTDAVMSESSVPVYVVRAENASRTGGEPEFDSGVIVPLDGSQLAESALDRAVEMALLSTSPIYLLRAMDEHAVFGEMDKAEQYLNRLSEQLAAHKVLAIPQLLKGDPGELIVQTMEKHPGCLVVMTSRGAGGLTRWMRGSVADWLIQRAPGPVVLVAPTQQALLGSVIH